MPLNFVRNDITRMRVDAIVNAANNSLLGGGGVDGAIHRAAGPELLRECRGLHGCETGCSKRTRGYRLPCKYVIHTVGPVWRGGGHGEAGLLASCYRTALALARESGCESVAFPMISTGVYGYPRAEALQIAVREIAGFLLENDMTVYIVVFTGDAVELTGRLYGEITSFIDDVYVNARCDLRGTARRDQSLNAPRPTASKPGWFVGGGLHEAMPMPDVEEDYYEEADMSFSVGRAPELDEMLARMDEGFPAMLLREIDARHMTDAECYRRANIDRRLFNKIKNNPGYRPSKQTVLAFALALRLSLPETREMLGKAGFALSRSSKADIVVEYCIRNGNYDIFEINQVLFKLDLQPLGY